MIAAEDEVAQGAAADARYRSQKHESDDIELAARGGEAACRGENKNARIIEYLNRCHRLFPSI